MTGVLPALLSATLETLLMVAVSVSFCVVFGLTLGAWLAISSPQGIAPSRSLHQLLPLPTYRAAYRFWF